MSVFRPAWVVEVLRRKSLVSAVRDERCGSPASVTLVQPLRLSQVSAVRSRSS